MCSGKFVLKKMSYLGVRKFDFYKMLKRKDDKSKKVITLIDRIL